jgi:MFS family permease
MDIQGSRCSRRGWAVIGATFMTLVFTYGAWYSYSVFLVALLREYGWTRSVVAGAFSVFLAVQGLLAPPAGGLLRRFGPRRCVLAGGVVIGLALMLAAETTEWWHLYVAFGGMFAAGMSLAGWIPTVVLVWGWYPHRVSTMVGVASAGIGIGVLGVVPLAQFLIEQVGWRWAYRALAVLILGWTVPATLGLVRDPSPAPAGGMPPRGGESEGKADSPVAWTLAGALRSARFWWLAGVYFTGSYVTQMLMIHQVAYLVDHGVPAMTAATVSGVGGLMTIVGKLGWGVLSDRTGREQTYALGFACVLGSIGALVLAGASRAPLALFLFSVLVGLGFGVLGPVTPAAASDLFGGPGFPTIFGVLFGVMCLGMGSGTWSAGELFDRTGSYAVALWVGAAMAILSPVLLWLAAPRRPNPSPVQKGR